MDFFPQKNLKIIIPKPDVNIKSYIERCKENIEPNGELEIRWTKKNGRKIWYICCSKCGNIRLLKAQNGLRCHYNSCNTFFSWELWNKKRIMVHKLARFGEGLVGRIEQDTSKSQKINKEIF